MPNQIPYSFMGDPMNNYNPNMEMPSWNVNEQSKIKELEQRINVLEQKVKALENNPEKKLSYDYQTSMNMM